MSVHKIVLEPLDGSLEGQAEAAWALHATAYAVAMQLGYNEVLRDPKMANRWTRVLSEIERAVQGAYPANEGRYLLVRGIEAGRKAVEHLKTQLAQGESAQTAQAGREGEEPCQAPSTK